MLVISLCSKFLFRSRPYPAGFSLIELLVTISIAGILFTLVFINFQESREQTRDEVLQTTLVDLQLALEQYKLQNGRYPTAGCPSVTDPTIVWFTQGAGGPNLVTTPGTSARCNINHPPYIQGLVPDYIPSLPVQKNIYYQTNADGSAYKMVAYRVVREVTISDNDDRFSACPSRCLGPGEPLFCDSTQLPWSYAVYSPGAECW